MKPDTRKRYIRRIKAELRYLYIDKARLDCIPARVLRLSEFMLWEVVCAEIESLESDLAKLELEGLNDENYKKR